MHTSRLCGQAVRGSVRHARWRGSRACGEWLLRCLGAEVSLWLLKKNAFATHSISYASGQSVAVRNKCSKAGSKVPAQRCRVRLRAVSAPAGARCCGATCCGRRGLPGWDCARLRACRRVALRCDSCLHLDSKCVHLATFALETLAGGLRVGTE